MEDRQRVYTVVAVVAVVAVLLSCIVGAAAGAVAGLIVGQEQGRGAAERVIERERAFQAQPQVVPLPEEGELVPRPAVPRAAMQGALVLEVISGTPAEQAGLRPGDVILAVDRVRINAMHNLGDVLAQYRSGDRVTLTVWSGGETTTLRLVLGEHPTQPGRPYLGIRYQMNTGLDLDQPNE